MSERVARIVSIVLHPFAVFTALALIAAARLEPASLPRTLLGIGVVVAIVWAFVWQRHRSGRWSTVDASQRHERPLLYLLALVLAGLYWLWMGGTASPTSQGVLTVVVMLCVAGVLNRWIKLSLHMASLAFASVALLPLSTLAAAVALALLPVLAWSRLRLGRHRMDEVLGGTGLGVLAGLGLLLW